MTDIKVGQIYFNITFDELIAITWIAEDETEYHYIRNDGHMFYGSNFSGFSNDKMLITQYPTWQEAVNSPEFRGDNNAG